MRLSRAIPSFVLATLLAPLAQANDTISITPFAGFRLGDSFDSDEDVRVELSDESAYGVAISWYHSPLKEGEILISHSTQDLKTFGDTVDRESETDVTYVHGGGKIWFSDSDFRTSLGAGIGFSHFKSDDDAFDSETKFSMHIGLGALYEISDSFALRADSRLFASFFNSDHSIYCVNGECLVTLKSETYIQTEFTLGMQYTF